MLDGISPTAPAGPDPAPPGGQISGEQVAAFNQAMRDAAQDQPRPPESHWYDRPLGALQAVGGVGEAVIGGGLLAAPEPTMLTKVAGVAVAAHGADDVWTGLQTAWTGQPHETLTQQAATEAARTFGANPQTAAMIGVTADMVGGLANPEGRAAGVARGAELLGAAGRVGHDAQSAERIGKVLQETVQGAGNLTSAHRLSEAEALDAGVTFLGTGYRELGKLGSGVFRSADGLRQFRIDSGSLAGAHAPGVPHVHFEVYATPTSRRPSVNNHVPITP